MDNKEEKLKLMRAPFPANQIGKLAKGSKAQMQCDAKEKKHCDICGGFHHPKLIHLDFVGHAALTDRLLDVDPFWYWEPLSFDEKGLPAFDEGGGLWIRLFVCGHSRIGYGNAESSQYKEIGSREKEVIGDALRNAAMRFGAALELWHKGDLHIKEDDEKKEYTGQVKAWVDLCIKAKGDSSKDFRDWWPANKEDIISDCDEYGAKQVYDFFKSNL